MRSVTASLPVTFPVTACLVTFSSALALIFSIRSRAQPSFLARLTMATCEQPNSLPIAVSDFVPARYASSTAAQSIALGFAATAGLRIHELFLMLLKRAEREILHVRHLASG